jgi:glycosyltransferase involved in cell wall biosynthesis
MHIQTIPLVSVVVTTRNEERNIANCLKSIKLQTYKPIEIIVVDNNSADETKTIAREYADIVVNKGPERSAQRNYGICDLARGEFAMFIDADMVLSPLLVEECVNQIQLDGVVALHIDEIILGQGLLAKIRRFERSFYSGTVIDGARFFYRSIFCELGGFDESLPPGPEDWDLDKRMKMLGRISVLQTRVSTTSWDMAYFVESKGVRFEESYVGVYHNEAEQSLLKYLKKKSYYSSSMSKYVEKWTLKDLDIKKQLGLKYRYFFVFVEEGRWTKLARSPLISCAMFGLRLLVGIIYLVVKFKAIRTTKPNNA